MDLSKTIRPSISRFTFVFIGLAIAVFTWGLEYKLSLYYPTHSVYHQVPEAKLLSRNEQSTLTEGLRNSRVKAPGDGALGECFVLSLIAWMVVLPVLRGSGEVGRKPEMPCPACARAALTALFFRPPPFLA